MIPVMKVIPKEKTEKMVNEYKEKGYVHYTVDMVWEDLKATYTSEYLIWTIINDLVQYVINGYKILFKPYPGAVPVLYRLRESE